jgi:hypothetical protein
MPAPTHRFPVLTAALALLLAAGVAAQEKKPEGPKLYRWVDKQGKVHYDDALPPEAVNEARREYNTRTGTSVGTVDRALTAEERAALAAQAAAAAQAASADVERKRQEDIMMASYETEMDMRRAYGERIGLLTTTIESTDISIRSLSDNLQTILAQASDTELDNRRVLDERKKVIADIHAEKMKQEALQRTRRADLAALNAEFARMLQRYRQLKGAAATAPAIAAPAPTPPAPPAGG